MTYIVLAAGRSRRMGFDKVFTPLGNGEAPLRRIAILLRDRPAIVVVPPNREDDARRMAPNMLVVVNAETERGMAHSLRVALQTLAEDEDFGVFLGDKPFARQSTLELLEALFGDADVVYPVDESGTPGHPVLFSRRVRERALALPDGDTISLLRKDPSLRRETLATNDRGAFDDVDTPEQWRAADA